MGRRWGKTVLGGVVAMAAASMGGKVAWIVPTYRNGRPLWRWAETTVGGLKAHGVRVNRSDRLIEFPNGGLLGIYSADSEDGIRGEAFHLAILDEASKIPQSAYTDVIQPTLADYDGDVILISSPYGKNWFYHEYVAASADGNRMAAWNAPTSANPNPNIKRAFEMARSRVPDRTYRAEWLAQFVEDGGEVFRHVRDCVKSIKQDKPIDGQNIVIGVDLGKLNDFTVFTVADKNTKSVLFIDRFNQIDYTIQLNRLIALCAKWKPSQVVIERNIGEMFIEQARRAGLPVTDFQTTTQSKLKLIDDLVVAFESEAISIYKDDDLINELEAYAIEKTASNNIRYGAPAGLHDDMVMSLALAWHGIAAPKWFIGTW